jgi:hypothetical protein
LILPELQFVNLPMEISELNFAALRLGIRDALCGVALLASVAALPLPAAAELGGDESSVLRQQVRMKATHSATAASQFTMHELRRADGSTIREYMGANGTVFAVAWDTRYKPNLKDLFGTSYPTYDAAVREEMRRPGVRRQFGVRQPQLVVSSTSNQQQVFRGRAWVPTLVPAGLDPSLIVK